MKFSGNIDNRHLEKRSHISPSRHLFGIGLCSEHTTLTIDPVECFSESNLIFCENLFCLKKQNKIIVSSFILDRQKRRSLPQIFDGREIPRLSGKVKKIILSSYKIKETKEGIHNVYKLK